MEKDYKKRAPGHPKAGDPPLQHMEAIPAFDTNAIPVVICPWCKRGGSARVLRRQKTSPLVRDCACQFCGKLFGATPIEGTAPMRWVLTLRTS